MGANSFQVSLLVHAGNQRVAAGDVHRQVSAITKEYPALVLNTAYLQRVSLSPDRSMPFFFQGEVLVIAVLAVWALATVPQTINMVSSPS